MEAPVNSVDFTARALEFAHLYSNDIRWRGALEELLGRYAERGEQYGMMSHGEFDPEEDPRELIGEALDEVRDAYNYAVAFHERRFQDPHLVKVRERVRQCLIETVMALMELRIATRQSETF